MRAYTRSAKDALDEAGISAVRRWTAFDVPCSYNLFARLQQETEGMSGIVTDTEYGADVTLKVLLPEERAEDYIARIIDITAGTVHPVQTGTEEKPVPLS